MRRSNKPARWYDIEYKDDDDGTVHRGAYKVEGRVVTVRYGGETRNTLKGGASAEWNARMLLLECVFAVQRRKRGQPARGPLPPEPDTDKAPDGA